jgi:hypothetical protein
MGSSTDASGEYEGKLNPGFSWTGISTGNRTGTIKTIAMGSDEYHNNVSPSIVGYAWIRMY